MPSLNNLAPELLESIFIHLQRRDIVSLLKTCRYLHRIGIQQLWATFFVAYYGDSIYSYRDDGEVKLRQLAELTKELGPDALGYKYISKIIFNETWTTFLKNADSRGFQKILGELIRAGKTKLREVRLLRCDYDPTRPEYDTGFLLQLKKYSESKSTNEFSMEVESGNISPFVKANVFNPLVLTKLEIRVSLGDSSEDVNLYPRSERRVTRLSEDPSDDITTLALLFAQAINLRRLSLQTDTFRYKPRPIASPELSEPLTHLQNSINGLKRLQVLGIGGTGTLHDGIVFHPSFFVTPPENCKVVKYGGQVSIAWWRRFAACPFTGVEELHIYPALVPLTYGRWYSSPQDEDAARAMGYRETWHFWLGDVAMTGLKKLVINDILEAGTRSRPHIRPRDLKDCLYRRNRVLHEINKRRISDEVVANFQSQIVEGLSRGIEHCAKQIAQKCAEDWMEQNGMEDATTTKCLRELSLGNKEQLTQFSQFLSDWIEKNTDSLQYREQAAANGPVRGSEYTDSEFSD
ncbi:hypothetical protein TWF281_009304 [Arthrobotrys megalospora]